MQRTSASSTDAELLDRLTAFCEQNHIKSHFKEFAAIHAQSFSDFDIDDEQSHTSLALFEQYEVLFENAVQSFLDIEKISTDRIYTILARVRGKHDSESKESLISFLSILDYTTFAECMQTEAIEQQRAAKEADEMGFD